MDTTLLFVGVLVSLLITFIKTKLWKTANVTGSILIVAAISLIGAGIYTALIHYGYWDAFWKIIVTAGAFYAYVTKNVKDLSASDIPQE
jgi:hypothetical membrane protein